MMMHPHSEEELHENNNASPSNSNYLKQLLRSTLDEGSSSKFEYLLDDDDDDDEDDNDIVGTKNSDDQSASSSTSSTSSSSLLPAVRDKEYHSDNAHSATRKSNASAGSSSGSAARILQVTEPPTPTTSDVEVSTTTLSNERLSSPLLVREWQTRLQQATQQHQELQTRMTLLQQQQQMQSPTKNKVATNAAASTGSTPRSSDSRRSSIAKRRRLISSIFKTPNTTHPRNSGNHVTPKSVRFAPASRTTPSTSGSTAAEAATTTSTPRTESKPPTTTTVTPPLGGTTKSVLFPTPKTATPAAVAAVKPTNTTPAMLQQIYWNEFQTPSPSSAASTSSSNSSNKSSPLLLLSPEQWTEVKGRNQQLQSSWQLQKSQSEELDQQVEQRLERLLFTNSQKQQQRTGRTKLATHHPRRHSSSQEESSTQEGQSLELKHAQEMAQLKRRHKMELDQLRQELENVESKEVAQQELHLEAAAEQDRLHQDTLVELHETRQELEELQQRSRQDASGGDSQGLLLLELQRENERLKLQVQERDEEMKEQRQELDEALESLNRTTRQLEYLNQLQQETIVELEHMARENEELQQTLQEQALELQAWQSQCQDLRRRFQDDQKAASSSSTEQQQNTTNQSSTSFQSGGVSSHVKQIQVDHAVELEELERQMQNATSLDLTPSREEVTNDMFAHDRDDDDHRFSLGLLSPILPAPVSTPDSSPRRQRQSGQDDDLQSFGSAPPTPRIDDLIDELGQMDQERTILLDQMNSRYEPREEELALDNSSFSRIGNTHKEQQLKKAADDNDSLSMLDATLDLLHKMKDMLTTTSPGGSTRGGVIMDEKEISVLEQLEVLSEMMGYNNDSYDGGGLADASLTLSPIKAAAEEDEASLIQAETVPEQSLAVDASTTNIETSHESNDVVIQEEESITVWKDLVAELRRQIAFLEWDRDEIVRTTQFFCQEERRVQEIAVEAAAATARREGYERAQATAQKHLRVLYHKLCPTCQATLV